MVISICDLILDYAIEMQFDSVIIAKQYTCHGGRSQVVKAVVCGTTIRGFKSHRPPSSRSQPADDCLARMAVMNNCLESFTSPKANIAIA